MNLSFIQISPIENASDVSLDSEIVFRLFDTSAITQASLNVYISTKIAFDIQVINSGVFVNEWTGSIIDNLGDGTDLTIVLCRPITSPLFEPSDNVFVGVDL